MQLFHDHLDVIYNHPIRVGPTFKYKLGTLCIASERVDLPANIDANSHVSRSRHVAWYNLRSMCAMTTKVSSMKDLIRRG
jgi:hypothetical protein